MNNPVEIMVWLVSQLAEPRLISVRLGSEARTSIPTSVATVTGTHPPTTCEQNTANCSPRQDRGPPLRAGML